MATNPLVVLFGYDASTFTQKIQLTLKLKGIKYTFIKVPSMMPRPILRDNFNLLYRKIPVLSIDRDLYVDTSIITEALEHRFSGPEYRSLYPKAADGRSYRPLIRGFSSYWTDRPLFRVTTGLIPASVWRSDFGKDRMELIGHKLDPDKLEKKLPQNLSLLDMQLSILEPMMKEAEPWIFSTATPSLADVTLYYQLKWGSDISSGKGVYNLTAGQAQDTTEDIAAKVFNKERYPALVAWYERIRNFLEGLPNVETQVEAPDETLKAIRNSEEINAPTVLLPTPAEPHTELDQTNRLTRGAEVSVVPDDTGRDNPTYGALRDITPEEIVIDPPKSESQDVIPVRIHFPRLGFVVRPTTNARI